MNKEFDLTANLIRWLPLSTLLLLSFGILRLSIYYYFFNFNILEYLDISEILPLMLKDFLLSFVGIFVGFFTGFLNPDNRRANIYNKNLDLSKNETNFFRRLLLYFKAFPILYLFTFALLVGLTLIIFSNNVIAIVLLISVSVIPQVCFILPKEIINNLEIKREIILSFGSKVFIYLTVIVASYGICQAVFNAVFVKYYHSTNQYSIELSNKTLISSDTCYYIGHTKSNVFFYKPKNQRIDIYPVTKINKISPN